MAGTDIEIEIKSLLGSEESAQAFRETLKTMYPSLLDASSYTQLNHYFQNGDPQKLVERLAPHVDADSLEKMKLIAKEGTKISVRTREMNGDAKVVFKASLGSDSSSNGVTRMEIETTVPEFTLQALDEELLAAGYEYQAKWSRTREEYSLGDVAICLDKNAGYGYIAEFEKVIQDNSHAESTRDMLHKLMDSLGVSELPQDRLERMFSYYNEHWPEYYGTEEIFTIQ